ncbi:hypothetical protein [Lysinibacillus sp. D4B1_S16]|uniref:hypothetical protein n=1 Tax=Lysinibacillus sp. D4B1_S16 TaxID=2941231 RepID=UPI0020BFD64E|nr:hypothetical protein [Lysinibacillus sp. D4B1_S16]
MRATGKLSNRIVLMSFVMLVALLAFFIVITIYTAKSSVNKTIGVQVVAVAENIAEQLSPED